MPATAVPYKNSEENKKKQVAAMFNNIAHRYDLLNHLLSLGIHKLWRKRAIQLIKNNPKRILDIATGTGDFAIEAMKLNPEKIVGIDISEGMLNLGREKIKNKKLEHKIELISGDSENIAFPDNTFDAATAGFGVRNFENLEKGLSEMYRVIGKGGVVSILEFSKPKGFPVRQFYYFYFTRVTPFIGKLLSKDRSAYTYLPESVRVFPDGNDFLKILTGIGYKNAKRYPLSFGIASVYIAEK